MSKIIHAVKNMISKSDKITCVQKVKKEVYFMFNDKYMWSIIRYSDTNNSDTLEYYLSYYTGAEKIEELLSKLEADEYNNVNTITYTTSDLKTSEAYETFQQLHQIVEEKSLGVDKVLDEIIAIE